MSSGRVVYTSAGVITSIGAGVEAFEEALYAGKSGHAVSARLPTQALRKIIDIRSHQIGRRKLK